MDMDSLHMKALSLVLPHQDEWLHLSSRNKQKPSGLGAYTESPIGPGAVAAPP